ncbi:MAG: serine/threonine-protein kinase, partial [Comamonadaceae bacterium]
MLDTLRSEPDESSSTTSLDGSDDSGVGNHQTLAMDTLAIESRSVPSLPHAPSGIQQKDFADPETSPSALRTKKLPGTEFPRHAKLAGSLRPNRLERFGTDAKPFSHELSKSSRGSKALPLMFTGLIGSNTSRHQQTTTAKEQAIDAQSTSTPPLAQRSVPKFTKQEGIKAAAKRSLELALAKGDRLFDADKLKGEARAQFETEARAMASKAALRGRAVNVDVLVDLYEQHALDEFIAKHADIPAYALAPELLKEVRLNVHVAFKDVREKRRWYAKVAQLDSVSQPASRSELPSPSKPSKLPKKIVSSKFWKSKGSKSTEHTQRANEPIDAAPNLISTTARHAEAHAKARAKVSEDTLKALDALKETIAFTIRENIDRNLRIHGEFAKPVLTAIGLDQPRTLFPDHVMVRLNNRSTQAGAIEEVATALATQIATLSERDQFGWITSDGEDLQRQVKALLDKTSFAFSEEDADDIAAQIQALAMSRIPGMCLGPNKDELTLGTTVYRLQKKIGDPSAGTVYLYASGDRQLVVKSTAGDNPLPLPAAMLEARYQMKAAGSGSPHVVDIKGAIRTHDGHLLTLMEFASRGDVNAVMTGLSDAVRVNKVKASISGFDPVKIKEHVISGMLKAVEHMHRNKIVHIDLNGRNLFMDSAFTVKLGDFGTAQLGDPTAPLIKSPVDNPYYVAPEAARLRTTLNKTTAEVKAALTKANPKMLREDIARLVKAETNRRMINDPASQLTTKADMWSVGIMLYEAIKGKHPFPDSNFPSEVSDFIFDFCTKDETDRLSDLNLDLGNPVDQLIFKLLDPDPAKRPSAADVLLLNLFKELDPATAVQWHDALHEETHPVPLSVEVTTSGTPNLTVLPTQDPNPSSAT